MAENKIKLLKPVTFEGKEYTEIPLDLDELRGEDMISVERQFLAGSPVNESVYLKELSKEYQILIAARAAKLPLEFFSLISAKDFSKITIRVQNFLLEEG